MLAVLEEEYGRYRHGAEFVDMRMQGPHHVAQKSITTGAPEAMIDFTSESVNLIAMIMDGYSIG